MISQILNDREKTHGSFCDVSNTSQALKKVLQKNIILPERAEAIYDVLQKIARIGEGDKLFTDHWVAIAGYAELRRKRCVR